MNRRNWISLPALALANCASKPPMPPGLFPETVDGGWIRTEDRDMALADAPDPVPRSSVDRLHSASYKGPGELVARVYLLDSEEAGSSLAGRWRPSADTVFFSYKRYFVVVRWTSTDRKAVQSFVAQLQRRLGAVK